MLKKAIFFISFCIGRIRIRNDNTGSGSEENIPDPDPQPCFKSFLLSSRFEWSWQHPKQSRRLNHLPLKKSSEKSFDYCIRKTYIFIIYTNYALSFNYISKYLKVPFKQEIRKSSRNVVPEKYLLSNVSLHSSCLSFSMTL